MSNQFDVSIVIPAYNQAGKLVPCVFGIEDAMKKAKIAHYEIIIAEDGSSDGTYEEAKALSMRDRHVRVLHSQERLGKGGAIMHAFSDARGRVLAFLDADGATDPTSLGALVKAAQKGGVAIGSRYLKGSDTNRKAWRLFFSKGFNFLVRTLFSSKVHDHQCGFKAFRADVARKIFAKVKDRKWFWDTEVLVIAQRLGCEVAEIPVEWKEKPDTSMRLSSDIYYMARSMARFWLELNLPRWS